MSNENNFYVSACSKHVLDVYSAFFLSIFFLFSYLRLNDMIEVSATCRYFYTVIRKKGFFTKKLTISKGIYKEQEYIVD